MEVWVGGFFLFIFLFWFLWVFFFGRGVGGPGARSLIWSSGFCFIVENHLIFTALWEEGCCPTWGQQLLVKQAEVYWGTCRNAAGIETFLPHDRGCRISTRATVSGVWMPDIYGWGYSGYLERKGHALDQSLLSHFLKYDTKRRKCVPCV